jgi:hypothetical protein
LKKAKLPLIKMIQKDRYDDIFAEIDMSLTKMTGLTSPNGDKMKKRIFWQRMGLSTTI